MPVSETTLLQLSNFVAGDHQQAHGSGRIDCVEPATGQIYALLPDSDATDIDRAVNAAEAAWPAWAALGAEGRAAHLRRLAEHMEARQDELIAAEVRDNGMTRCFAAKVEVPRGAANFRAFAEHAAAFMQPRSFSATQPPASGSVRHEPVGVVGVISPWNLPLLLLTWKIAPALAVGNCIVAKPSEVTPLTAHLLGEMAQEAGLPPGVLNIVHGSGALAGAALVQHPSVRRVSFTGSTRTGWEIQRSMNGKVAPALEMGGKNASIVCADADLELTVPGVLQAAFANQGQICLCGSRILVEHSIYSEFKSLLTDAVTKLRVGDPMDLETEHGATVSKQHYEKILQAIEEARTLGGKILCGGAPVQLKGRCAEGYFIAPTLIEGLGNASAINQEEIFGPVATLQPFACDEDAIALANDSRYGLSASVWSSDRERATRIAEQLDVGMAWINGWNIRVLTTPFGGVKQSGNGHREGVPDAMEFFTEKKTICMSKERNESNT